MYSTKIYFSEPSQIKKFNIFANSFESDIDIYIENERFSYDAKSLITLFDMNLFLKDAFVRINELDEDELERFKNEVEQFK